MTRPTYTERLRHILMVQWGIDHIHVVDHEGHMYLFSRAGDGMYCLDPQAARYVRRTTAKAKR